MTKINIIEKTQGVIGKDITSVGKALELLAKEYKYADGVIKSTDKKWNNKIANCNNVRNALRQYHHVTVSCIGIGCKCNKILISDRDATWDNAFDPDRDRSEALDGELTSKKIRLSNVKSYLRHTAHPAVQEVVAKYDDIGAKFVPTGEFVSARDRGWCRVCKKTFPKYDVEHSHVMNVETKTCKRCEREMKRRHEEQEHARRTVKEWYNLTKMLRELNKGYKLEARERTLYGDVKQTYHKIVRTVKLAHGEEMEFSIMRERVGSYRGPDSQSYALRIYTSKYDVKADKLKRDFKSPDIAKHLNAKIENMIEIENNKAVRRIKNAEAEESLVSTIKRELGVDEDHIEDHFIRMGKYRSTQSTSSKRLKLQNVTAHAYKAPGSKEAVSYTVRGIDARMNAQQLKEVVRLVNSFSK